MHRAMNPGQEGTSGQMSTAYFTLSTDRLEVPVVLPCLNEANSIGICVRKPVGAIRYALNSMPTGLKPTNGSPYGLEGFISFEMKLSKRT
jgi:hypothetical protein